MRRMTKRQRRRHRIAYNQARRRTELCEDGMTRRSKDAQEMPTWTGWGEERGIDPEGKWASVRYQHARQAREARAPRDTEF